MAKRDIPDPEEVVIEKDVTYTVSERPSPKVRRDSAVRAVVDELAGSFIFDIIVPAIQGMLMDMVDGVTDKIRDISSDAIMGEGKNAPRYVRDGRGHKRQAYRAYDSYSRGKTTAERNSLSERRAVVRETKKLKSPVDVADIPFPDERTAQAVLSFLTGRADKFRWATMDDLYTHRDVNIEPDPQDAYFGWDLDMTRGGTVYRDNRGIWRINIVQPVQIPDEER